MNILSITCMKMFIQREFLLTFFVIFCISCSWEEIKQAGYQTLQEPQTQRCLYHSSRPPAECLNQPPYEAYQKQMEDIP